MARRRKIYKVSKAEKEIKLLLEARGFMVIAQFVIPNIPYIYDFYLPELNLILEYNGSYWHANPAIYKSGTLIQMVGFKDKILVDYIWDKDELKKQSAIKQGYSFAVVWESIYKERGYEAVLQAIKQRTR